MTVISMRGEGIVVLGFGLERGLPTEGKYKVTFISEKIIIIISKQPLEGVLQYNRRSFLKIKKRNLAMWGEVLYWQPCKNKLPWFVYK